jgi:hypothetical protein
LVFAVADCLVLLVRELWVAAYQPSHLDSVSDAEFTGVCLPSLASLWSLIPSTSHSSSQSGVFQEDEDPEIAKMTAVLVYLNSLKGLRVSSIVIFYLEEDSQSSAVPIRPSPSTADFATQRKSQGEEWGRFLKGALRGLLSARPGFWAVPLPLPNFQLVCKTLQSTLLSKDRLDLPSGQKQKPKLLYAFGVGRIELWQWDNCRSNQCILALLPNQHQSTDGINGRIVDHPTTEVHDSLVELGVFALHQFTGDGVGSAILRGCPDFAVPSSFAGSSLGTATALLLPAIVGDAEESPTQSQLVLNQIVDRSLIKQERPIIDMAEEAELEEAVCNLARLVLDSHGYAPKSSMDLFQYLEGLLAPLPPEVRDSKSLEIDLQQGTIRLVDKHTPSLDDGDSSSPSSDLWEKELVMNELRTDLAYAAEVSAMILRVDESIM